MSDITVICCWNNESVYNDFVNSLKSQTYKCELIGIDNRGNNKFKSCVAAYNSVLNQVRTKYVIFSHQDILLTQPDSLEKFLHYLEQINLHDILGVAGVKFDEIGVFSNILHKFNLTGEIIHAGDFPVRGKIMECDTVDECFFGGYVSHFKDNSFDSKVCNNWHLYAVDSCLHTKHKYSGHVFVCDVEPFHLSSGNYTLSFYYGFYKICCKYAKIFPFIRTTCTSSKTDFLHRNYYLYRYFKSHLKL